MNQDQKLRSTEIASSSSLASLARLPRRNLGCAILVAAIEDYMSMDEQAHTSALRFLFPQEPAYREHFDWVVSMADGVNRKWLREALDQAKARWDKERLASKLKAKLEAAARRRLPA